MQDVRGYWILRVSLSPAIRYVDHNCAFATFDRVLLQVWRGAVTPRGVQELLGVGQQLVREHGSAVCSSLSVVESVSPPPSERVRPLLSACYRELAKDMRLQLFVAEGSGFRAAIVRGVGLAVSTFAPSLLPFKFASSITEASVAIGPTLSAAAGGASALPAAIEVVRSRLDALTAGT
jgi:hypothetical protein